MKHLFLVCPDPGHFDLSLPIQVEMFCDYSEVIWENDLTENILRSKTPGVVVIQSGQFPSLGANHDPSGNETSTILKETTQSLCILECFTKS